MYRRLFTKRHVGFYFYNNHFCLKWKSQGVSFNQAIHEIKTNFKMIDSFITEEIVNSHSEFIYIPRKTESQMSNFFVYDLETHNTDGARP